MGRIIGVEIYPSAQDSVLTWDCVMQIILMKEGWLAVLWDADSYSQLSSQCHSKD